MIDVKALAQQAGIDYVFFNVHAGKPGGLEAFAALVLEAAAVECDEVRHPWGYSSETPDWLRGTDQCAEAIRAMKPPAK